MDVVAQMGASCLSSVSINTFFVSTCPGESWEVMLSPRDERLVFLYTDFRGKTANIDTVAERFAHLLIILATYNIRIS